MDKIIILVTSGLLGLLAGGIYVGIRVTKFRQSLALMATNIEIAESKLNEFISQIDREELMKTSSGQELLSLLTPLEADKLFSFENNRLDTIITNAVRDSTKISDRVDINVELKNPTPHVKNREEFKNIISRLIENSIKAVDKSNVGHRSTIRINGRVSGDSYILSIEDVGPGIPKDVAEEIFKSLSEFKSFSDKSSDLAEQLFGKIDQSNNTITVKATSDVSKQINRVVIELPARQK